MKRPITGFDIDEHGDPIALLSCGHPQHVRHGPPFTNRPWVTTEAGRNSKLGETLDCVRCDRFELPEAFIPYKRTPVFTAETVPAALQKDHSTKPGVWGKIVVVQGRLRYRVDALDTTVELAPDIPGIVIPEVLHFVTPTGPVEFFVEFYRAPTAEPGA